LKLFRGGKQKTMFTKRWAILAVVVMLAVVALAACQPTVEEKIVEVTRVVQETVTVEGQPVEVTRVVTETVEVPVEAPVEEAPAPTDLIICMAQEPETLYWYGTNMLVKAAVLHGVYENLTTNLSYGYQAQGLEKLPSLADGDAVINVVDVAPGDTVADVSGEVVTLEAGVTVKNAAGEDVEYDGSSALQMEQMAVDFTFKPLVWSDGTPVTADDSVYAFELGSDPDTPSSKFAIDRTASYEATGDLSVRWTGLPGWRDSTYFLNVWTPLPRAAWGSFTGAELVEAEESNRMPMGHGPFKIAEWVAGDNITLVRNENYYRASEGYPKVETVTFKFIPDTNQLIAQLLAGQCDIGTQDGMDTGQAPFLIEAESQGLLVPYFQTGTVYEHIDFNLLPIAEYAETRPDWFSDVRVRQAMTMCTDRQSMVDNIMYGRSEVIHTYIPSVHPLYPEGLTEWPYDVEAANALLDEVGFVDTDGDGIREYSSATVENGDAKWDGTPFKVTLGTTAGNEMRQQLTQIFKENLVDCGVDIELYYLPSSEWFADGPDGVLFGRKYDLGEFAWLTGVEPACNLYITSEIPGDPELGFSGWGGSNNTGWSNPEYDVVCQNALGSLPGTPEYEENHKEAQRIFSENVPIIPLFLRLKVAAARPEVKNFSVDPTENSELYNLYEIGFTD
jgi:peptide/nickel transport system substrate-binding protein